MARKARYLRHLALLFAIVMVVIALPKTMGAPHLATAAPQATGLPDTIGDLRAAPSQARVDSISFSLRQGGAEDPRFRFGPRGVWASINYSDAQGQTLQWVLRFGPVDVSFGNIVPSQQSGRAEVLLERMDRDFLMVGRFDLVVCQGGCAEGGLVIGSGSFEIFDEGASDDDDDDND
jgi:hypothetical protein